MNQKAGIKKTVELLAPGGSMEGIRAAVNAGADAVYAGGRLFGARAFAENPETDDLLEAIDYCHLHGVKLYLTVNTLLKEHELTDMLPEFLAPIYERGLDAVLVQDFGVFRFLRERFPDLPLHASTQMTVTGADGVKLLQEMGAERVVLSRELSLEEIRHIRAQCDVALETFVHGALCYCYSGKCLMSSLIGGRSGNRGRCAQPCRLPYDLYAEPADVKARKTLNRPAEQYLLSPKDICTLRLLPDLIDAGIASFKIEGRMKSAEYAAGVTSMYRGYIDMYLQDGRDGCHVEESDEAMLSRLFSRGSFSEGYYHTRNGRKMMTLEEKPDERGDALRHAQETAAHFRGMYVDAWKKLPLDAHVSIQPDVPSVMRVTDQHGHTCTVEGFVPMPAKNRPADRDMVLRQICKTGNSDFAFESVELDLAEGLFVEVRGLNELRRCALARMRDEILKQFLRPEAAADGSGAAGSGSDGTGLDDPGMDVSGSDASGKERKPVRGLYLGGYARISHPEVTASVCTAAQLEGLLSQKKAGGVYLDHSICTAENAHRVWNSGRKAYLMLPAIWREDTARTVIKEITREFGSFSPKIKASLDGILVRSYDQLHALREADLLNDDDGFEVIADAQLYTWNRYARRQLSALGVTMDTMPCECSMRDLEGRGCEGSECVVYGFQTLMTSAQCLTKITTGCRHESGIRYLRDRKGILFPVRNDCAICTNMIYNSVPLDLVTLSGQVKALHPASVRYQFTVEGREQTRRILKGGLPDTVTREHFRKGVE